MSKEALPYELLESLDPEHKFPGLYHQSFDLRIDGARYLKPGVALAVPEERTGHYIDDLFLIVQEVKSVEEGIVSFKLLTWSKHTYAPHNRLTKGVRLYPMFSCYPPEFSPLFAGDAYTPITEAVKKYASNPDNNIANRLSEHPLVGTQRAKDLWDAAVRREWESVHSDENQDGEPKDA